MSLQVWSLLTSYKRPLDLASGKTCPHELLEWLSGSAMAFLQA